MKHVRFCSVQTLKKKLKLIVMVFNVIIFA